MKAFVRSIAGQTSLLLLAGIAVATMLTTVALSLLHVDHPLVLLMFVVCVMALAYPVAQRFTKPLRDLAAAATRLGDDIHSAPLPEMGPTEVREAAAAFNAMQARIRRDVSERSSMLAAITHDLQTPLTRLRLRLEKVEDETLRGKLLEDLAAMRATVNEGLDLAHSLDAREQMLPVDLDALLSSVCDDARDAGQDVTLRGGTSSNAICSPNALRRCITNLLDNAVGYGGFARVESRSDTTHAYVVIRDGGPGIPQAQIAEVFEPFYRLESSRSRETGGTGLGLTIARNIAHRYRGAIILANHPDGGLEVTLTLALKR